MGAKIVVRDLWKTYPTHKDPLSVLEGVSLEVTDGEFLAVVGPSGCGKSTLLNILAGFDRPDRGEVIVDGKPVAGPSPKAIFIFQQGSVFPWLTVRRNLMFGLGALPKA